MGNYPSPDFRLAFSGDIADTSIGSSSIGFTPASMYGHPVSLKIVEGRQFAAGDSCHFMSSVFSFGLSKSYFP